MADKLRKFRKDNYTEKRFGKDINVSTKDEAPLRKEMSAAETKSVEKAKPSSGASPLSFSAAFAAARKNGDKTFSWKGKSFTTELASDKKSTSTPARRAPATSTPAKVTTALAATKKVEAPSLKSAFERAGSKSTPITSAGKTPRLLDRSTKGVTRPMFGKDGVIAGYESEETAAKRIREGKEKAKAGNPFYKSYLEKAKGGAVKKYAEGGKIDGIAVRGKTKAGRKK